MSGASSLSQRPVAASFDSSPLVRHLASLDGIRSAPTSPTVAERLSHWLAWTDAIALSAALGTSAAPRASAARPTVTSNVASAIDRARRTRAELAQQIGAETGFSGAPADDNQCRAAYRLHQRTMAERIETVRAGLRAALATQSAEHAELAALDAVLDRALAPRERELLASVPTLLGRHRALQRTSHSSAETAAEAPAADAAGWQRALLAELDTRWQPVEGLIASLGPMPATRT